MSEDARYSRLSIALHWVMFVVMIGVYGAIEGREFFERGTAARDTMKWLHFSLGLTILALMFVRLAARFMSRPPPIVPAPPAWQRLSASAVHLALTALMIGLPIGGWILLSAEGDPIPFFFFELPPLVGPNEGLAEFVEEAHETGGKIGYALIAMHAAAALFHHYVLRDNGLTRMMPRWFKQR